MGHSIFLVLISVSCIKAFKLFLRGKNCFPMPLDGQRDTRPLKHKETCTNRVKELDDGEKNCLSLSKGDQLFLSSRRGGGGDGDIEIEEGEKEVLLSLESVFILFIPSFYVSTSQNDCGRTRTYLR